MRKIQSSAERMKKLRKKKKTDHTFDYEKFKKKKRERIAKLREKKQTEMAKKKIMKIY